MFEIRFLLDSKVRAIFSAKHDAHPLTKNANGDNAPDFLTASSSMLFHPSNIVIHPVLEEFFAAFTNVADLIK